MWMRENSAREKNQWLYSAAVDLLCFKRVTRQRECARTPSRYVQEALRMKYISTDENYIRRFIIRVDARFNARVSHFFFAPTTSSSSPPHHNTHFYTPRQTSSFLALSLFPFAHLKNLTLKYGEGQWIWLSRRRRRRYVWPGRALFVIKIHSVRCRCSLSLSHNQLTLGDEIKKRLSKRLTMMIWNKSNSFRVIFKRHFWFINLRLSPQKSWLFGSAGRDRSFFRVWKKRVYFHLKLILPTVLGLFGILFFFVCAVAGISQTHLSVIETGGWMRSDNETSRAQTTTWAQSIWPSSSPVSLYLHLFLPMNPLKAPPSQPLVPRHVLNDAQ